MVLGWGFIGVGVKGVLDDAGATRPGALLRWLVGSALAYLVIVPAVIGVGWLTARLVPAVVRAPLRVATGLTAVVAVVAWPLVRGYGRRPSLPSALPLDYGRNLVVIVVLIWAATAAYATLRWRATRSTASRD